MRSGVIVLLALVTAGCAAGVPHEETHRAPVRLLVTGSVELTGPVAAVAEADPEGLLREVRLMARRADLAIVASAQGEATDLLAGAGFAVVDPPVGPVRWMVSSLGRLLSGDTSATGSVLEVLADEAGVVAYRIGRVTHPDLRVHFEGWDLPIGDAVLVDGEWWSLARAVDPAPVLRPPGDGPFEQGDLTIAAIGDVTGDGLPDMVASYRHPFRSSVITETLPEIVRVDSEGRSAHLGVFALDGEALWAAGLIPRPVSDLAACHGSVALAYTEFDGPGVAATGAATWQGLGLSPAPDLPGPGVPGCADVDDDGRLDPVVLERFPAPE